MNLTQIRIDDVPLQGMIPNCGPSVGKPSIFPVYIFKLTFFELLSPIFKCQQILSFKFFAWYVLI